MPSSLHITALCVMLSLLATIRAPQSPGDYFKITVIDEGTGRGVPLVELKTTSGTQFYTDSNGIVAFDEPGMMNQEVYFHLKSHGYEYPADGFGFRGVALKVTRGGSAVIKIKRLNIAERLYRITGEGIYRDSLLTGQPVPIKQPLLNAQVAGQDAGQAVPYRGKLYWFWGDTNKVASPLGNFSSSGATSEWPARGGLDPSIGIDLHYFVNESGFSKEMCPSGVIPGPGPKWIFWLLTIADEQGRERLIAQYERIGKDQPVERGLVIFNDQTESFERLAQFDLNLPLHPAGRPFRVNADGQSYYYFAVLYPDNTFVRVKAGLKHLTDQRAYEAFTCLAAGSKYDKASAKLDRARDGRLIYAWKANTDAIGYARERELIAAGKMKPSEAWFHLQDVVSGAPVPAYSGSVQWNEYRQRWVMIAQKNVGEIWYAEADTPIGPWVYARQIVSHDHYTFYLPVQHPFFDQDGGRIIYFEGTYTNLFSGNPEQTPRYDYNQIMYRVRLDDPRLALPAPVYRLKSGQGTMSYLLREGVEAQQRWNEIEEIPFFAVPPSHEHEGQREGHREELIPIFARIADGHVMLQREAMGKNESPLFYALPAASNQHERLAGLWRCKLKGADGSELSLSLDLKLNGEHVSGKIEQDLITQGTFQNGRLEIEGKDEQGAYTLTAQITRGKLIGAWKQPATNESGTWEGERVPESVSPAVVGLYEYRRVKDGVRFYSTRLDIHDQRLKRSAPPLCRVWRNPAFTLMLDRQAKPVPITRPSHN